MKRRFCLVVLVLFSILLIVWTLGRHRTEHNSQNERSILGPLPKKIVSPTRRWDQQSGPDLSSAYSRANKSDKTQEYALTGNVTSEAKQPLPGATVRLFSLPGLGSSFPTIPESEWPTPVASVECNQQGTYFISLSDPVPDAIVMVEMHGHAVVEDFPDLSELRSIRKDYALKEAPGCLNVRVIDEKSRSVGDAQLIAVTTMPQFLPDKSMFYRVVRTDRAGKYTFSDLAEELVSISASAPHFYHAGGSIRVTAGPCQSMEIKLPVGHIAPLRVKNKQGIGIAGASLISGNGLVRAKADAEGRIHAVLPPNQDAIECTISARGYVLRSIWLDPASPLSEVVLDNAEECRGQVMTTNGLPIQGAVVTIVGTGGRTGGAGTAKTDGNGRFALFPLAPPITEVRVRKEGYVERRVTIDKTMSTANLSITLDLSSAGLFGQVLFSNGDVAKQIEIVVSDLSNKSNLYIRYVEAEDGRFQINDVPSGTYRIDVRTIKPFEVASLPRIQILPDSSVGPINVQLLPRHPVKK